MTDLVPFILSQEQAEVKKVIMGRPLSVIFDGTTRLGEAIAIVVRFIDNACTIEQRLIHLQLLVKSMTREETASVVTSYLLQCTTVQLATM